MASQAPGAEFLERRLARATAVPPAARSPEVAAFVEAMQLLREACELLPLNADGSPALPNTPANQRKVGGRLVGPVVTLCCLLTDHCFALFSSSSPRPPCSHTPNISPTSLLAGAAGLGQACSC
jgi:hypothetical protein